MKRTPTSSAIQNLGSSHICVPLESRPPFLSLDCPEHRSRMTNISQYTGSSGPGFLYLHPEFVVLWIVRAWVICHRDRVPHRFCLPSILVEVASAE